MSVLRLYDALGTGGILRFGDVYNSELRGWGEPESDVKRRDSDTVWVEIDYLGQDLT